MRTILLSIGILIVLIFFTFLIGNALLFLKSEINIHVNDVILNCENLEDNTLNCIIIE